jgi:hypothetical protein
MSKNKTALEQFAIALYENGFLVGNGDDIQELLNKAKEMEKEQHRRTYVDSTSQFENEAYMPHIKPFEQYYKETYE